MATYWDTQNICFRPAVKVKPLSRWYDPDFQCWFVKCRVTSRFTGECGKIRSVRAGALYAKQRVIRGSGRLVWTEVMQHDALLALPEHEGLTTNDLSCNDDNRRAGGSL